MIKQIITAASTLALAGSVLASPIYLDNNLSLDPNLWGNDRIVDVTYAYDSTLYGHVVATQTVTGSIAFPADVYHVNVISAITANYNFQTIYDSEMEACATDIEYATHTLSLSYSPRGKIVCGVMAGKVSTQSSALKK